MNYCLFAHKYYSIQSLNEFQSLRSLGRATNSASEARDKKKSEGAPHVEAVYHKNLNGMDSCFLFKLQKVEVKILSLISSCL